MSTINGTNGIDALNGKSGSDVIFGKGGNDTLVGNDVGGTQLLVDGGFETAPTAANSWGHYTTVGGWHSDTGIEVWGKNFLGTHATEGNKIVELDYDTRFSKVWQDVHTEAGKSYDFSFDFSERAGTAPSTNSIQVYWNNHLVGGFDPQSTAWQHGSLSLTGTGGLDRLEFRELASQNNSLGGLMDNVSLKASGSGDDVIFGGSGSDMISGGGGNDVLYGSSGVSSSGSSAVSSAHGSAAADNDTIHGGNGNDTIYGNRGDDHLFGDAGNDIVNGGRGNDVVAGGAGNDRLAGNSGDDILSDGSGSDVVEGGTGNDRIVAGAGDDIYRGGAGFDTLDMSEATQGVTVDLAKHTANGLGNDRVYGIEEVIGSSGNDTLRGSTHNEVLNGGAGNDVLRGHGGSDTLTGGTGADTFVWTNDDIHRQTQHNDVTTITDFSANDHLDFTGLLRGMNISSASDIDRAVTVTDDGHNSHVFVKQGDAFSEVAVLQNFTGHTAQDMAHHGMILV